MLVLGIETSCDETAVAVIRNGRECLSSKVFSQVFKHKQWGGVIPEVASRMHLETINRLIHDCLAEANVSISDIDAIAATQGPGLIGSLMVGFNVAKTLAWVHDKRLIPVNHLYGHVCANFLETDLEPPFLCMLASGGHTQIIAMPDHTNMEIMGETVDDAAGEAFDKVARLMNLAYPGGPHLDKLAQTATDTGSYRFPVPRINEYNFSFSGLKTAVLRLKEKISEETWEQDKAQIAKAFQECIAKTLFEKVLLASNNTNLRSIVLAGGVAANSAIRAKFREEFSPEKGFNLIVPSLKFCTDNAAMIASAGYFLLKHQEPLVNPFSQEVYARAS